MANAIVNPGFETAPPFTAVTTTAGVYIDGTAAGSATNDTWRWGIQVAGGSVAGSFAASFDSAVFHSGLYSLKLSVTAIASSILVNPFAGTISAAKEAAYCAAVNPSTAYKCSFWMKTNLVSGSATTGAQINFAAFNASAALQSNHASTSILTTTDWTQYQVNYTTGGSTFFIVPQIGLKGNDGAGTLIMDAWFDDLFIEDNNGNFIMYNNIGMGR